jgi:hypothetical protein
MGDCKCSRQGACGVGTAVGSAYCAASDAATAALLLRYLARRDPARPRQERRKIPAWKLLQMAHAGARS